MILKFPHLNNLQMIKKASELAHFLKLISISKTCLIKRIYALAYKKAIISDKNSREDNMNKITDFMKDHSLYTDPVQVLSKIQLAKVINKLEKVTN